MELIVNKGNTMKLHISKTASENVKQEFDDVTESNIKSARSGRKLGILQILSWPTQPDKTNERRSRAVTVHCILMLRLLASPRLSGKYYQG